MVVYITEDTKDIRYKAEVDVSRGTLIVKKHETVLLVDGRYQQMASEKACNCRVAALNDENIRKEILTASELVLCGETMSYDRYMHIAGLAGDVKVRSDNLIAPLRMIKSEKEIALMRESAKLAFHGLQHMILQMKEGVTEAEIALEFINYVRKRGASDVAFEPIVAFGKHNTILPHHRAGDTVLRKGDPVIIDVGCILNGYCSDMTRSFAFKGGEKAYMAVLNAVKQTLSVLESHLRPGVTLQEMTDLAHNTLRKAQFDPKDMIHSLGHGVGLQVHESPFFKKGDTVLAPHMVITLEPALYIPGVGGVRIENTYLIDVQAQSPLFAQGADF